MAGVTSAALEQPLTQSIEAGETEEAQQSRTAQDGERVERWRRGGGVRGD